MARVGQDPLDPGLAEGVAPGALGRNRQEERVIEQPLQKRGVRVARERDAAAVVERAADQAPGEPVEQRSCRSGVEGPRGLIPLPEDGPVRDPPEVQDREGPRRVSKQDIVHQRHEGSALPPGRHVPGPQVGHGAAPRGLGDLVPVPQLEGGRPRWSHAVMVEDGLPVARHEVEGPGSGLGGHATGRGSESPPQVPVEERDGAHFTRPPLEGGPHPLAQALGEGLGREGELLQPHEARRPLERLVARRGDGDVDPVGGGPREHPRDAAGRTAQGLVGIVHHGGGSRSWRGRIAWHDDTMAESTRKTVLVVDDDGDIRETLEMTLRYEGFDVWTARNGKEALARLAAEDAAPAVILTDLKMPDVDGLELLDRVMEMPDPPPVVLISGHGDVPVAVDAMQRGAANFLEKPLEQHRVIVTLNKALRERDLVVENKGLRRKLSAGFELVGDSSPMSELRDSIERVARSDASVLVTGENGVGKELVARNVHLLGDRASGPFITVNCAAIPAELVESELFGHVKGSFTGAHEDRVGHFEAADGGTLFLDEIGDMPIAAQAKVLRALETHEVVRVGASQTRSVNIRVVAATNADLNQAVEDKTFRLDLFYRLNVVPLRVPALRERAGDIGPIARHLLERQAERIGRSPAGLADDAVALLESQPWPGNVRQLRNVLEAASIFAADGRITAAEVARVLENGPAMSRPDAPIGAADDPFRGPFDASTFEQFKNEAEALFFSTRLGRNDGNVKRTAEELGMQRSHLYKKLDRYGLK